MKYSFHWVFFLRRIARGWSSGALAFARSCTLVAAPALKANSATNDERRIMLSARDDGRFDCGYDPRGAEDETYSHRLNTLRLSNYNSATRSQSLKPQAQDEGDIAVIEDDGTMIISPSKFDLKNRSLVFT